MSYYNPYANAAGPWIRGNFHSHCRENSVCASVPLDIAVEQYATLPSQILALTDHNCITDKSAIQAYFPGLFLLNGFEHSQGRDLLFIGTDDVTLIKKPLPEALLRAMDALTIICHPDPLPGTEYWSLTRVKSLPRLPDCLEVYNGHYGTDRLRATGSIPLFTHIWDELLTEGCRIWGVANDDFHDPQDFNNAFTMICVPKVSRDTIIAAMKLGHCYASTGLLMKQFILDGDEITVDTAESCAGMFIGPGGENLTKSVGSQFHYTLKGESYVRFEGKGDAGLLFTQPVWRTHLHGQNGITRA